MDQTKLESRIFTISKKHVKILEWEEKTENNLYELSPIRWALGKEHIFGMRLVKLQGINPFIPSNYLIQIYIRQTYGVIWGTGQ